MVLVTSGASASYNGLVTTIQHRLSSSFSLLANYTCSHCIDVVDAQGDIEVTSVENPSNINMDRGSCGFDFRHIYNTTIVAISHARVAGWREAVLNDWQIAPLVHIQSGAPFNVTSGVDNSRTSMGNDRPNLINPVTSYTHQGITRTTAGNRYYLNRSAFSENAVGTYGNLGRNAFRGLPSYQVDSEVSRLFPVHDRVSLDLRLECFNVLNHPNLAVPNANLSSPTFGQITASGPARIFQGAVKIVF